MSTTEDLQRAATIESMKAAFAMTRQRCYNESCRDYRYYGGRGIKICERWLESFENFLEDMGLRPEGCTLERKDNNGDYCPENCVWATRAVQSSNTRSTKLITFEGETHSVSEWERIKGFKQGTLKARLGRLNYTVEEAFAKSVVCGAKLPNKQYKERKPIDKSKLARGLDAWQAGFTKETLEEARAMAEAGASFSAIGRHFGVSVTTASNAVQRKGAYKDA